MDVVQVLSALGSVALIVGIGIGLVQLRGLRNQQQQETVIRANTAWFGGTALPNAYWRVQAWDYDTFADFQAKASIDDWSAMDMVATYFEMMGVLHKRGLAELDLIDDLFAGSLLITWRKLRPIIEGYRVSSGVPDYGQWFEHVARALDRRLTSRGETHPSIDDPSASRPAG